MRRISFAGKEELKTSLLSAIAPQLDHAAVEGEFLRNDRTERFELLPLHGIVFQQVRSRAMLAFTWKVA